MTEGKGKYGSLLSEIRNKQTPQPPTVLLPEKRRHSPGSAAPLAGNRSPCCLKKRERGTRTGAPEGPRR
jgi:hypothetical protein